MPKQHRIDRSPAVRLAASGKPQFRASLANDGALELCIYGDIVDAGTIDALEAWGYSTESFTSALAVKKALDNAGPYSSIRLRINSPGGDAFEGMAIHSLLTSQPKPVTACIDGVAASSASIVAMAASVRIMGRTAMMMAHDAWTDCRGNKNDLLKMAGTLDKVDESIAAAYMDRTGMSLEDIKGLMNAETWMTAQDCVDKGFATGITALPEEEEASAMAMARGFKTLAKLKNLPPALQPAPLSSPASAIPSLHARAIAADADAECACDCQACMDGDCSNCSMKGCSDANCKDCPMQSGAGNSVELPGTAAPDTAAVDRESMEFARARHKARAERRVLTFN